MDALETNLAKSIQKIVDDCEKFYDLTFKIVLTQLEAEYKRDLSGKRSFIKAKAVEVIQDKQAKLEKGDSKEENERDVEKEREREMEIQRELEEREREREKEKQREKEEKEKLKKERKEREEKEKERTRLEKEKKKKEKEEREEKEEKEREKGESDQEENEENEGFDPAALGLTKEELKMQRLMLEGYKHGVNVRTVRHTRSADKPAKSEKKSKKRPKEEGENGDSPKKKKSSHTNRPKVLSPALAAVLGESTLPRPDVVKRLIDYVKANGLQDPNDGRKIILDDALQSIFKIKKTDFFKLQGLLSKHLSDPSEVI